MQRENPFAWNVRESVFTDTKYIVYWLYPTVNAEHYATLLKQLQIVIKSQNSGKLTKRVLFSWGRGSSTHHPDVVCDCDFELFILLIGSHLTILCPHKSLACELISMWWWENTFCNDCINRMKASSVLRSKHCKTDGGLCGLWVCVEK